jgi:hypothetical protein
MIAKNPEEGEWGLMHILKWHWRKFLANQGR